MPNENESQITESAEMPSQADVLAWVRERWPDYVSPVWRAMKLGEEAGEVVGAVLKESLGYKTPADIEQETAQLVMCALGLAEAVGFDLWAAVAAEWVDMSSRVWEAVDA